MRFLKLDISTSSVFCYAKSTFPKGEGRKDDRWSPLRTIPQSLAAPNPAPDRGSPKRVGRVLGWLNKGAKTIPQPRIRSAAPFTQGSQKQSLSLWLRQIQLPLHKGACAGACVVTTLLYKNGVFLPFYAYCSSIIFLYFLYEIALKAMPTTRIAHQDAMVRDQPIISEMRAMP